MQWGVPGAVMRWWLSLVVAIGMALSVAGVNAQGELSRLVQSDDGTLYILAWGQRWPIAPAPISGEELAAIPEAAFRFPDGVIALPSGSVPPPVAAPPTVASPPAAMAAPPVELSGRGQTATQGVRPPAAISVARFRHTGTRNFIVKSVRPDRTELLVNTIGAYDGSRPIVGDAPLLFDIEADGQWTIALEPIGAAAGAAFGGRGDAVSGIFPAPPNGAWEFGHQGAQNYIVKLHCANGSQLIQNRIGTFSGSAVVQFRGTPCFWEVQADGTWSHAQR